MAVLIKNVLHVFLFLLFFIFYILGLGLGLQISLILGVALWVIAASILALNLAWIISRWS